jgi:pimeloyl-ACP methyl ester carboxylesterase
MRVIPFLLFGGLLIAIAGLSGCATWSAERNAPMIGEWIDVEGERMHAFTAGPRDGDLPPVVLIHGASANLRDMQMSLGEPLSRDRFVVMVDRPGRGYSERPKDGYALDIQARYIHGVVKSYGLKNPLIVGQSFGGAVALSYALQYQEEMSGLVLLAPVSHQWPGGIAWYNSASQIPVVGFLLRQLVIPIYGQLAAEDGIEETFLPDAAPENYYQRSGLALLFRPGDFKSNASDIAHLKQEIIRQQDRYGELQLPVAIMTGTSDTTVSPEIHSKTLVTQIEGATLTLFPDTGHALHHSQTEKIIETIDRLSAADMAMR